MKRVLFRRIFIAYLITTPLLLLSLELYLSSSIKDNYITNLRAGLINRRLIPTRCPLPLHVTSTISVKASRKKQGHGTLLSMIPAVYLEIP